MTCYNVSQKETAQSCDSYSTSSEWQLTIGEHDVQYWSIFKVFCETTVTFVTNTVATISQVHFVKAPQGAVSEKLERKDFDYLSIQDFLRCAKEMGYLLVIVYLHAGL